MATGNKQQVVSSEMQPIVGGDSDKEKTGPARFLHGFRPHGKVFSGLVVLAALIVVIGAGWFVAKDVFHVGDKVYAQAAGHKIYKNNVDNLIGNNKGISQRDAATALADKYLTEAMARNLKVTITNQDIESAYGPSIETQKTHNKYEYQYRVNQLYFAKLQTQQQGDYKGELLVTNFSRNVPFQSGRLPAQEAANPSLGNPAAIAADKKYAEDLITSLYNQIESKKITFNQAIQIEQSDPVVGEQAYGGLPHSGSFDTASQYNVRNSLIQPASVRNQLRNIKPGQTSKPFVVRVADSVDTNSTAESYFLVIHMDSVSGGQSDVSFAQYFAQAKKNLGYKIYV